MRYNVSVSFFYIRWGKTM